MQLLPTFESPKMTVLYYKSFILLILLLFRFYNSNLRFIFIKPNIVVHQEWLPENKQFIPNDGIVLYKGNAYVLWEEGVSISFKVLIPR